MPIDFPTSPTLNQIYSYNNRSWIWNGSSWAAAYSVISAVPSGSVTAFAGSVAPTGYLLCDGSSISSTNYLALHAVISNTYGGSAYTGAGGLNFNVPDLRGRFPIGSGQGTGLTNRVRGTTYGTETHTLASGNIPQMTTGNMSTNASHTHSGFSSPLLKYVASGGNRADLSGGSVWIGTDSSPVTVNSQSTEHTHTVGTASPTAVNHVPPSLGLNYIIKT